jgi:hypothetical protein
MLPTKANNRMQEMSTANTLGTFHLLFRNVTIGFKRMAKSNANNIGTIMGCPKYKMAIPKLMQMSTSVNLKIPDGFVVDLISIEMKNRLNA